jgi:hypothetical protein
MSKPPNAGDPIINANVTMLPNAAIMIKNLEFI